MSTIDKMKNNEIKNWNKNTSYYLYFIYIYKDYKFFKMLSKFFNLISNNEKLKND